MRLLTSIAFVFAFLPSLASALTSTITIDGTVDASGLGGSTSEAFQFTYNFDPTVPGIAASRFSDWHDAGINGSITLGSQTLSFVGGGFQVFKDNSSIPNGVAYSAINNGSSFNGAQFSNTILFAKTIRFFSIVFPLTPGLPIGTIPTSTSQLTDVSRANFVLGLSDRTSVSLAGSGFNQVSLTTQAAPAPVPLPASAWLMISGIGALVAFRRKRRKGVQSGISGNAQLA